jgi:hypothetical protein
VELDFDCCMDGRTGDAGAAEELGLNFENVLPPSRRRVLEEVEFPWVAGMDNSGQIRKCTYGA